ncbi:MAG TPA: hypothetical protein VGI99_04545 [Gemmataceae bacterium]|jgi:hypothetical protein
MPRKPPSDAILLEAAEMRAAGETWEAVGAKLHRSGETVRRWPQEYAERWQKFAKVAEHAIVCEGSAESVRVLRAMLRSKDDKVRKDAARALTELRTDLLRHESTSEPAAALTSDGFRIAAFLDGKSDDELARLAAHNAADAPVAEHAPAEPGGAPCAA